MTLGPKPGRGRTSRRWRVMKAVVRSWRNACCYCGGEIDYDGDPNGPRAFSVAHRLPVSTHPHLAEEWTNILGAAHRGCNSSAGVRDVPLGLGLVSEDA